MSSFFVARHLTDIFPDKLLRRFQLYLHPEISSWIITIYLFPKAVDADRAWESACEMNVQSEQAW